MDDAIPWVAVLLLATVLGIVKSHAGFVTVESQAGTGTTFAIFIPAMTDETAPNDKEPDVPLAPGRGQRVLVVDDEPAIRETVVQALIANGYRAYTAEDGTDALALYHQRRTEIDLVLTDISMAQMDGIALTRALRRINPNVRVVVSSGHFPKESLTVLENLGVKVFLDKPYTADKLLRSLHEEFSPNS